MRLLFKTRRKSSAQSEAASAVKDLSDLVSSYCPYTEIQSHRDLRSMRYDSPSELANLHSNSDVGEDFLPYESGRTHHHGGVGSLPPDSCQSPNCSYQSGEVSKHSTHTERLKIVQVVECHIEKEAAESLTATDDLSLKRTAKDEVVMAMAICISCCICAHLTFDALIGLERFRWLSGITKTLKISLILYVMLRTHKYTIKILSFLGAHSANKIHKISTQIFAFVRAQYRTWRVIRRPSIQQNAQFLSTRSPGPPPPPPPPPSAQPRVASSESDVVSVEARARVIPPCQDSRALYTRSAECVMPSFGRHMLTTTASAPPCPTELEAFDRMTVGVCDESAGTSWDMEVPTEAAVFGTIMRCSFRSTFNTLTEQMGDS